MSIESTSIFRWAGSKRQIVPTLAEFWRPSYKRYVEPFVGSAALFFHVAPQKALLGDLNPELIGTYRVLRDSPLDVFRKIAQMPPADKEFYYMLRAKDPTLLPKIDRAARFIYLNRFCFNGLYRTNRNGQFNVPYGGGKSGSLPTADRLVAIAKQLLRCTFVSGDFEKTLARVRPGDFVYLDPPYWVSDRRVFREYSADVFTRQHLSRLEQALRRLEAMRVDYVLSYEDGPDAEVLSGGRVVRHLIVRRNIAGFASSRRRAPEVVITPTYLGQAASND